MILSICTNVEDSGIGWIGQGKSMASEGSEYFPLLKILRSHEKVTNWTGPSSCVGSKWSHWNWVMMWVVWGSIVSDTVPPNLFITDLIKSTGIALRLSSSNKASLMLLVSSNSSSSNWKKWKRKEERKAFSWSGRYHWNGRIRFNRIQSTIHQSIIVLSKF